MEGCSSAYAMTIWITTWGSCRAVFCFDGFIPQVLEGVGCGKCGNLL